MLVESYNHVASQLQPQVQGTCGVYSFYNAVCILRDLDNRNPAVPPPKKSQQTSTDATGGSFTSLRQYAKRQLQSGQGEILTEREMLELVAAHGYAPLAFARRGGVTEGDKKSFIEMCAKSGYPVLVPYLADEFGSDVKYTSTATKGAGAHWSLILGLNGDATDVIEPNAPKTLKSWPFADFMQANAKTDDKTFVQYWTKTVYDKDEFKRQTGTGAKGLVQDRTRGIAEYDQDPNTFRPAWDKKSQTGHTKVYDLGGTTGARQDDQDLNHVLIAIVPPFKPGS